MLPFWADESCNARLTEPIRVMEGGRQIAELPAERVRLDTPGGFRECETGAADVATVCLKAAPS